MSVKCVANLLRRRAKRLKRHSPSIHAVLDVQPDYSAELLFQRVKAVRLGVEVALNCLRDPGAVNSSNENMQIDCVQIFGHSYFNQSPLQNGRLRLH